MLRLWSPHILDLYFADMHWQGEQLHLQLNRWIQEWKHRDLRSSYAFASLRFRDLAVQAFRFQR